MCGKGAGHQDGGSNRESRDEKQSSQERHGGASVGVTGFAGLSAGQGTLTQRGSICHALRIPSHQLPAARGAIPRESRSPGAATGHLCQQDHLTGQLRAPLEVRGPVPGDKLTWGARILGAHRAGPERRVHGTIEA